MMFHLIANKIQTPCIVHMLPILFSDSIIHFSLHCSSLPAMQIPHYSLNSASTASPQGRHWLFPLLGVLFHQLYVRLISSPFSGLCLTGEAFLATYDISHLHIVQMNSMWAVTFLGFMAVFLVPRTLPDLKQFSISCVGID